MGHSTCSDTSIMRGGGCGSWSVNVELMDIQWINDRY
jgi:hypothetical protein